MSELALKLIDKNKKSKAKFLDLGNCGMTVVPEELGDCIWLEELTLSNRWWDFDQQIWIDSQNSGAHNNISLLPESMAQLQNLRKFWCKGTENQTYDLANLYPIAKLTQLQQLDIRYTQVADISVLTGLLGLEILDITITLVSDIRSLVGLSQLRQLYIYKTSVFDLSPILGLSQLQQLDVSGTQISDLSPISNLSQLQQLSVSETQISDLSPILSLNQLQQLNVSKTQVSDLSPISGLNQLHTLSASETQISDLAPITKLTKLQKLFIYKTQVSDLTPIAKLSRLQEISMFQTQISDLSHLAKLNQLKLLYIYSTQVSDLTPIAKLTKLQKLSIGETLVSDLTPLAKLSQLQVLFAWQIPISDLHPIASLSQIQQLDLENTLITDITPILGLLQNDIPLKYEELLEQPGIYLEGCPLTNPPIKFARQGNEAVLRYFKEKEEGGLVHAREAKVFIVGEGQSGKTTLARKLKNVQAKLPPADLTTRGIEITSLQEQMPRPAGEDFQLHVWDFGGQNVQYFAHQFFLSDNAVYILVADERREGQNFEYWLHIIRLLGRNSPIIIVKNQRDDHTDEIRNFANICATFQVHQRCFAFNFEKAANSKEFEDLRAEIIHYAARLPHVEEEFLSSFVKVREKLRAEAETGKHYLSWPKYLELAPELSEDQMRDYANAFSFIGECQFFPEDASLCNFVFLHPKWIIDAIFELLYHKMVIANKGRFTQNETLQIWQKPEYKGMHVHLVQMMKNFEFCYRVTGKDDTYILPQRLPAAQEATYGWEESEYTTIQYRYAFLPRGLFTRLICRLHGRIEAENAWCDAVIFSSGKGRVFVREVFAFNVIELQAAGKNSDDLLNEVLRNMDDIHSESKYGNLEVSKMVPCPCSNCSSPKATKPHFYTYQQLQNRLEKGGTFVLCESGIEVSIDEVFGKSGVKKPKTRQEEMLGEKGRPDGMGKAEKLQNLKIFLSYSHAQQDYFKVFREDFRQYAKLPGFQLEVFDDYEIPLGADWDEHLVGEVDACNVMVLLVSQEFMNSNYIREKEFGAAVERLKSGKNILVVPVYFAPCQFEQDEELRRLQFFKPQGKDFDQAQKGTEFSYIDLVKFRETDGQALPNSNRQHYMKALMKKLGLALRKS